MNCKHRRLFQANNRRYQYFFGLSAQRIKTLPFLGRFFSQTIFVACICLSPQIAFGASIVDQINTIIEQHAHQAASRAHPNVLAENIIVSPAPLHPTLTAKTCQDLSFQQQGQRVVGRLTGKLSCNEPNWSAYVTYEVSVFDDIVVTSEAISRGATLQASQLTTRRADVGLLKTGYFKNIDDVVGFTARRTLKPGLVVTNYIAEPPYLVEKGDWVTIVSGSGAIKVTATGEALNSGRYGEQITIRNLSSKEKIKAWIIKKGTVSTRKSAI
ncbi:flagellar basal body P-ring formation protein FlgA [Reinekea forsetii]|nr:flagellar basal body P-ring formation protein FlgA [Reinekea forsetii]